MENKCQTCRREVPPLPDVDPIEWISCETCKAWFHSACLGQPLGWIENFDDDIPFFCMGCLKEAEKESDEEINDEDDTEIEDFGEEDRENEVSPRERLAAVVRQQNVRKGHAIVSQITGHDFGHKSGRQFKVLYEDGGLLWHWEKDLRDCLAKVDAYCLLNKLERSKLKPRSKLGATLDLKQNPKNWVDIKETLRLAREFGNPKWLQPQIFKDLGGNDGIFIHQIAEHAYAILWKAREKTCYICDGLNTFIEDSEVRRDFMPLLNKAKRIKALRFNGQKFADHCASSAAGLAIEMQRLHHRGGELDDEIRVPKSIVERIVKIAHKDVSERVNEWKPVNIIKPKYVCTKCGGIPR